MDRKNLRKNPKKIQQITELAEISIDRARNVFVNRPLNMSQVRYIGFDMDYTLAIYRKKAIEELAFQETLKNLVKHKGYPERILELQYSEDKVIRGLLVDREKGNLIKINRFKQVCQVRHGNEELPTEVYFNDKVDQSDMERFVSVDTLFSLPEAYLYTLLVEISKSGELGDRSFSDIYDDIRFSIDLTHRDGSLKSNIIADLDKYIYQDPHLALTLDKFIQNGKKLFVLTNSEYFYTEKVMSHLLDNKHPAYDSWKDYFEIIIVSGRKPRFFSAQTPFYVVDEATETETEFTGDTLDSETIYSQGNYLRLEELIDAKGKEILYVGDHIFGDILRSDKDSNWHTALVVEELEDELRVTESIRAQHIQLRQLLNKFDKLNYEVHMYSSQLNSFQRLQRQDNLTEEERTMCDENIEELESDLAFCQRDLERTERKIAKLRQQINSSYHAAWGPLFHDQDEMSRFGDQVRDYATLYTSRVSNFFFYPTSRYYKSLRDIMPHDRWLELSD